MNTLNLSRRHWLASSAGLLSAAALPAWAQAPLKTGPAHIVIIGGGITGVIPVGQAFLRAVQDGLATRDMYATGANSDGLIDLWFNDGTHASVHGSYLSALTLFGSITGLDPQSLGAGEQAAIDLGISAADAVRLQRVAALELGFAAQVPEPTTAGLLAAGLAVVGFWSRRRTVKA